MRAARDVPGLLLLLGLCLLPAARSTAGDVHVLQRGETLYRISRKYDVPVDVLQRYNGIRDPQSLRVGTRVLIPESYQVRKGDTLFGIARSFQVQLEDLLSLNGVDGSTVLKVGRAVYLPAGAVRAPPRAAPAGGQGQGSLARGSSPSGREERPATPAASGSATAVAGAEGGGVLWPLPGRREALRGRILGTVIYGETGENVVSVSAGRVIWSGPYRGFRRVVLIEGDNGYTYVYAGNEENLVRVGDSVRKGTAIGRLGKNAHQGTAQLYFLVYRNGTPVDPGRAPRS